MLEPFHGRILDPACGSGGMFVQSARFVAEHQKSGANGGGGLSIHGVEKVDDTGRLCRMNLAVHGLEGDIRHGGDNSYYDDPHNLVGRFEFVLANPPFNVDKVDKDRLKDATGKGRRFPFALPKTDNANYLWIQLFYAALNTSGRAGFVMANSASDARSSELEIRRQLLGLPIFTFIDTPGAYPGLGARGARRRRDGLGRPEHVLHGDLAVHPLVPRPRQGPDEAQGLGAVPRRAQHLPPDRPRPPRLDAGPDRAF